MPRKWKVLCLGVVASAALACHADELAVPVAPPAAAPVTPVPTPAANDAGALAIAVPSDAATPVLAPPVLTKFVDVTSAGAKVAVGSPCDVVFVAAAKGAFSVSAAGQAQSLARGDVAMASGTGGIELRGSGLAAVASSLHDCGAAQHPEQAAIRVARAGDAKDLSWAGGTMHAHLDLEKEISPDVYVGRIEGTAPVAEHDHATSWEVLCAVEASGTFTLDGISTHIVAPTIVAVPPGRKHSWQPDPGSKLVAVQIYAPPGPEQRFKTLAAAH